MGFYKAFVLMHLWNWFVTPIFRVSTISLFQALGLFFVVVVCTDHYGVREHEYWSKRIMAALDCCIPDDKKIDAKRILREGDEEGWRDLGSAHFDELVGTTVVLMLGWGIHAYLV
jgi:hypothetical protein